MAGASTAASSSAVGDSGRARDRNEVSSTRLLYDIFLGLLSSLVLLMNIVEWFIPDDLDGVAGELNTMLLEVIARADTVVCAFFFVDFIVQRRGWRCGRGLQLRPASIATSCMELMFCIPQSLLWGMSAARTVRTFRLVQVMRVLMATKQIGEVLRDVRALSVAVAVAFLTVAVWLLGAFAVLAFEFDIPGATIRTAEDALWWSAATVTTVGYGDAVPVSGGGRTLAAVLMLGGVSVYGATSGLITSFILGQAQQEAQREAQLREARRREAKAAAAAEASTKANANEEGRGDDDRPAAAAPSAPAGAERLQPGEVSALQRELAAQGARLEAMHQNMAELQHHMLGLTEAIRRMEEAKSKEQ